MQGQKNRSLMYVYCGSHERLKMPSMNNMDWKCVPAQKATTQEEMNKEI